MLDNFNECGRGRFLLGFAAQLTSKALHDSKFMTTLMCVRQRTPKAAKSCANAKRFRCALL
jgi:hypothetical protein